MKLSMHASFFSADNNCQFLDIPMLYEELINDKNKKKINLRHYLHNNIYDFATFCTNSWISALYTSFDYVRKTINYSTNK